MLVEFVAQNVSRVCLVLEAFLQSYFGAAELLAGRTSLQVAVGAFMGTTRVKVATYASVFACRTLCCVESLAFDDDVWFIGVMF